MVHLKGSGGGSSSEGIPESQKAPSKRKNPVTAPGKLKSKGSTTAQALWEPHQGEGEGKKPEQSLEGLYDTLKKRMRRESHMREVESRSGGENQAWVEILVKGGGT